MLSQHPNIVSLFGVSIEMDVWMVLDFIDGSNLFDILFPERGPPVVSFLPFKQFSEKKRIRSSFAPFYLQKLPSKSQIQYCRDMCNAIAFIHEKGYVHVDIKSLNMMVTNPLKL